jgi:gamma-glutamyltranspeptidase/glutathione hydrolase
MRSRLDSRHASGRGTLVRGVALTALAVAGISCQPVKAPSAAAPEGLFPTTWSLPRPVEAVEASGGMVASAHPLATAVGVEVLDRGGNAIDAAVAVGFALAVVLPEAGNIGGGGYLVHRDAGGETVALDYRETAPAAATRDMYLDETGALTDKSRIGHLASGVPGSVAGLEEMHRELGTLPWAELVAPAIELARAHALDEPRRANREAAAEKLLRFPAAAELFVPGGEPPAAGTVVHNPDLARTLERIAERGAAGFYDGETADLVVAEMERGGGLITRADLASYRPSWRDPLRIRYRGHTVWSMPPSSSGGVTLGIVLNVLDGVDRLPRLGSAELHHLETEAMRWAFVDRNRWLGDPDFVEMPLDRLLSQRHAAELRRRIEPDRAGRTPTDPAPDESESTTHYSIVDGDGNAASVTTTINSLFGNGVVVTGAGFLLNDEMDDFAAKPGEPNQFGLVQGEANAIEPGKRMLSSMSPTIVEDRGGDLLLVVGTPGGSTIITTVFQVVSNVIDHRMSLADAVAAPRINHQALPDRLFFEPGGLGTETRAELLAMGYELEERMDWSGDVQAILRLDDGDWVGVSDPRRGGAAMGVSARRTGAAERKVAAGGARR